MSVNPKDLSTREFLTQKKLFKIRTACFCIRQKFALFSENTLIFITIILNFSIGYFMYGEIGRILLQNYLLMPINFTCRYCISQKSEYTGRISES